MAKNLGNYVKRLKEQAKKNKPIRTTINEDHKAWGHGTVAVAKAFTKKTEPGVANLWTGRRENWAGATLAVGAASVYGVASAKQKTEFAPRTGQISYSGTAPIMDGDGVATSTNAPTLNASGGMVFGLHQARKG